MKHFATIPENLESRIGLFSLGPVPGLLAISSEITGSDNGISFMACSILQSVSYPNLATIGPSTGYVSFVDCAGLATVNFPQLQTVSASIIIESCPAITILTFPSVTSLFGFSSANNPACTAVNLPVLGTATAIRLGVAFGSGSANDPALSAVNLHSLTLVSALQIEQCAGLLSLEFPLLLEATPLKITHCALANLFLPVWLPVNGQPVNLNDNALTQFSVDHVLARCVAQASFVSGTLTLDGGANATPSAAGLTDKATLIGRGVTVTTN